MTDVIDSAGELVYEIELPLLDPPYRPRKDKETGAKLPRTRAPRPGPPLLQNWNQSMHWREWARRKKQILETVEWRAKQLKIPTGRHITVQLHYLTGERRGPDSDNLAPTLKAACDALARGKNTALAGLRLVPDDTPEFMTKPEPIIVTGPGKRRLWIMVTVRR